MAVESMNVTRSISTTVRGRMSIPMDRSIGTRRSSASFQLLHDPLVATPRNGGHQDALQDAVVGLDGRDILLIPVVGGTAVWMSFDLT